MSDILFIHSLNLHESHRMFAEAIDADFMPAYTKEFNGFRRFIEAFKRAKELPDYDVYLLEGGMPLFPAYLKKRKNKNIKVIGLLADETFINLVDRQPHYSFAETLIHRISVRCLDGAISVSPMVKEYAEKVIDMPIEIARPPISKENFVKLGKVKPDLESNIIISVGQPRYSIGMDILVEQFKHAKKEFPELELWIVGKGHPKEYESVDGVRVLGYVEELSEVFEKASLFVHAGRCSAYPVATLEAMRGGLPIVVSTMTGTKEIVERVENQIKAEFGLNYEDNKFIQPLNEIFRGIIEYYRMETEIRERMSEIYKEISEGFEPKKRCEGFKKAFKTLVK